MTSVTVNNKVVEGTGKSISINDVMEFVLSEVLHEDEVITSVDVNGKQLSYEEEQEILKTQKSAA